MTTDSDLCDRPAHDLAARLRSGELSARELMAAHLARIELVNPTINAIVTLVAERALDAAGDSDARRASGDELGLLHGLPVAHKDLAMTAGIRTTQGSPLFANFVPTTDDLHVIRLREAGAIALGKTNTPEFGAGSHTFNPVFGATANPYDPSRSAGGSSGGAAAALACGMVPLADGSDVGGSLRNPASFCGVVGLRPTPGVVPDWPAVDPWEPLPTDGPMGRCVADVALMLQAMAGPHPNAPFSHRPMAEAGSPGPPRPLRIGWSPTAGGLPVDQAVRTALSGFPGRAESLGWEVVDTFPDLAEAGEIFQILRAVMFEMSLGELYERHGDQLKTTIRWNVELARTFSAADVGRAHRRRGALQSRVRRVFEQVDLIALPTTQVVPFPIEWEYPTEIDGTALHTYLDWMRSCTDITMTGCPALSLPMGWSADGLPVGVQLVAPPGRDLDLLAAAAALEETTGPRRLPPIIARA